MKDVLKKVVSCINIVSAVILCVLGAIGVVCEIIGAGKFDALLATLNMPFGFTEYWYISMAALVVVILSFAIKSKCFEE